MEQPIGALESAVVDAVASASWLASTDGPAVALARHYAAVMDAAEDVQKAAYLGPHLLNALKALGLSPEARQALEIKTKVDSPVDELKQRRQRRTA